MPELVFVGLGSNLGDRAAYLAAGLAALAAAAGVRLVAVSSAYASAPVGRADQPEFLNAVALLRTELEPRALLGLLQAIERAHDRRRDCRWGPRTLDLDLLLAGQQRRREPDLEVPHPRLLERAFVLVPLLELAPDLCHPGTGLPLRRHLAAIGRGQRLARVGPLVPAAGQTPDVQLQAARPA